MKKGVIWIVLTGLIVTSLILASCSAKTTSSTSMTTTTNAKTNAPTTKSTSSATTNIPTTTTAAGNWWDSLGTPQYGGTMTLRLSGNINAFDPMDSEMKLTIGSAWMETLTTNDWTLNPSVFSYTTFFRPSDYVVGYLAQTWEITGPGTLVMHIRHGIKWQDIAPANGREFTADDAAYHYDRMLGLGDGFTQASPFYVGNARWAPLASVTATDRYTVVFQWKIPNPESMTETCLAQSTQAYIECPDAVKQWGNLDDWHHAIGTGPFILQDFISDTSATLVKNPNYWGYDERYPQNQLPYIQTLIYLILPDKATALAALRTGKIDEMDGVMSQDVQDMKTSNPSILTTSVPQSLAQTLDPRNDVKPFSDIKVREAMQMAINLPEIATNYYQGSSDPWPSSAISNYMGDWGLPYLQWPQDVKDTYIYNVSGAKQLLTDAGYPDGFNTDCVANSSADLALLQLVQSYLAVVNIKMSIRSMDSGVWDNYVRINNSQDALAFNNVGVLGGSAEPISNTLQFYSAVVTNGPNYIMVKDLTYDSFNTKVEAATTIADVKQILKDFCLYVAQQHYAISLPVPRNFSLYQPWLKGFNGQLGAFSWWSGSPPFISLYMARFWIDQNLK